MTKVSNKCELFFMRHVTLNPRLLAALYNLQSPSTSLCFLSEPSVFHCFKWLMVWRIFFEAVQISFWVWQLLWFFFLIWVVFFWMVEQLESIRRAIKATSEDEFERLKYSEKQLVNKVGNSTPLPESYVSLILQHVGGCVFVDMLWNKQ